MDGEKGLTLLEVVIALLLFSLMCVLLLSGQQHAAELVERASIESDMAYLLPFRLQMVALQPDAYQDGDQGDFPDTSHGKDLVDEEKIFGEKYRGYTWSLEKKEVVASGSSAPTTVEGGDTIGLLFSEEGTSTQDSQDAAPEQKKADEVDRMYFLKVTVYPPGYADAPPPSPDDTTDSVRPHSIWTAIPLPASDQQQESGK